MLSSLKDIAASMSRLEHSLTSAGVLLLSGVILLLVVYAYSGMIRLRSAQSRKWPHAISEVVFNPDAFAGSRQIGCGILLLGLALINFALGAAHFLGVLLVDLDPNMNLTYNGGYQSRSSIIMSTLMLGYVIYQVLWETPFFLTQRKD